MASVGAVSSCPTYEDTIETCLVGVWAEAEVLDGLTRVLWSTEEDDVGASWCLEGELVEGEALTAGLEDAGTGSGSELESADAQLWNLEETVVIGDSADDSSDLAILLLSVVLVGGDGHNLGDREWWGVDARHAQSVCPVRDLTCSIFLLFSSRTSSER